jgi:hypothetical protein
MARATTTRSKTGLRTSVREPVGTDDHPLESAAPIDNSPNSGSSQVPPSSVLAEEDPYLEQEVSALSEQEGSVPQKLRTRLMMKETTKKRV